MNRLSRAARDLLLAAVRAEARSLQLPGTGPLVSWLYHPGCRRSDYVDLVGWYEGHLMQVDTRSFIEWAIYVYGGYELASVRLLALLAQPGSVCVDVGANVGTYTLPLARSVGAAGAVHAFEPHPALRHRLLANLALNNFTNVTVSDRALFSHGGESTLYGFSDFNHGASSLRPSREATEPFACRLQTLDEYLETTPVHPVHLLKVDSEGSDLAVLVGANRTIEAHRPIIFVEANEVWLEAFDATPADLLAFLLGHGYCVWRNNVGEYELSWRLMPLRTTSDLPSPKELGRGLGWENWLAVHPEPSRRRPNGGDGSHG